MAINPVTLFTAARQAAIEAQAIVGGSVVNNRLILTRNNGQTIDAGYVKGDPGTMTQTELNNSINALLETAGTPSAEAATGARGTAAKAARSDHVHAMVKSEADVAWDINVNASALTKVYLRGNQCTLLFDFSVKINWASSWPLITLPAGYRPPNQVVFRALNASAAVPAHMVLTTDGAMRIYTGVPTAGQYISGSVSFPQA